MLQKNWFQHSKMRIIVQEQLTVGRKNPTILFENLCAVAEGAVLGEWNFNLLGRDEK